MPAPRVIRRLLPHFAVVLLGSALIVGWTTYERFQPAAITLGPNTTVYFSEDPTFATRVHEAVHRRQMRDKSWLGRLVAALRYNFDYGFRLDEEAEAKAGELCLQIHKFSAELPAFTSERSLRQAQAYRAWAWERLGVSVHDRVGEQLRNGERCWEILEGVALDLPPGYELSPSDQLKLATFHFLQAFGSSETDVEKWKARLELAGYADPAGWALPDIVPAPGYLERVAEVAAPVDSTITPAEAGRALHRLTYATAERMYTQLRPPLPGYRGRPLVDAEGAREVLGLAPERWPVTLLERALGGDLDEEEVGWLRSVAGHPAHADFEVFARAPSADIVGTRYRLPADEGWTRLALTDLEPIRDAFRAQSARAALAVAEGDTAEAERVVRTAVGAALQQARNAPFEVDVLEAVGFLESSLAELRLLREARGAGDGEDDGALPDTAREGEAAGPAAEVLPAVDVAGVRPDSLGVPVPGPGDGTWAEGARALLFTDDPGVLFRALPELAADASIPWAFRRAAYRQVALFDVCLGLRGDPESVREQRRWREAVDAGLIRRQSDRHVLELMRRTVLDLLWRSDVQPTRICDPETVAQPRARMAIMSSPPRGWATADDG